MLPVETRIGAVHLRVTDLGRSLGFYREMLALRAAFPEPGVGVLSASEEGPPLIVLHGDPMATSRPSRMTGLYHFAVLFPSRRELAHALVRLLHVRWPIEGASDHLVSEAIYLSDPDGNGIELYVDRPREHWRMEGGQISMATLPLDLRTILAEVRDETTLPPVADPRTTIGHIHLRVSDLDAAEEFYHGILGFDVMVRGYPGALFLAAGGYHHHIGVNIWAGRHAPRPPENSVGLIGFEVVVPTAEAREAIVERARAAGIGAEPEGDAWRIPDQDGNVVWIRA